MKKQIILFTLLVIAAGANAQQWGGASNTTGSINRSGRVGIGNSNPLDQFHVGGGAGKIVMGLAYGSTLNWGSYYIGFNTFRSGTTWTTEHDGANNGASIIYSNVGGSIFFACRASTGASNQTFTDANVTSNNQVMELRADGRVLIGTNIQTNSSPYKLYVEQGILTEKVKVAVKNSGDWSDFVFADDYKLRSLNEVESYIYENNHLPEIPSAEDVVKEGIDLGKMDAKLLQKIEELTLYIIDLNKKNQELSNRISQIESNK